MAPQVDRTANGAERIFVKWKTPTDELLSTARLAQALVDRRISEARHVCIAVPNLNWAVQEKHALDSIGQQCGIRIPNMPLSPKAKQALARLALVVEPDDQELLDACRAAGDDDPDLAQWARAHHPSDCLTLVKSLRLKEHEELAQALQHVCGDEDASRLQATILDQLAAPTIPEGNESVSIKLYHQLDQDFDYLFLTGCVDGLIPGPAAYGAATEEARQQATESARTAFNEACGRASKRLVLSMFVKSEARIADAMHLRYTRRKMEQGRQMAMLNPTPFFNEFGLDRPSTMGGQLYLRTYGLN